ncbi:MAG: tyrosine-type recombinase/integrase [Microscillaceae bacterium]|jgi:integrase/recombinase XerD|nr:tyrosine-type recombinase/integrase [Microscillaceae bacterium]
MNIEKQTAQDTQLSPAQRTDKVSVAEVMQIFHTYQYKPRNYPSIVKAYLIFLAQKDLAINHISKGLYLSILDNEKQPKNLSAYQTPLNKLIKEVAPAHRLIGLKVYIDVKPKTIIETQLEALFEQFLTFANKVKGERTKDNYRKSFKEFAKYCQITELNFFNEASVLFFRNHLHRRLQESTFSIFSANAYLAPLRQFAKYLVINSEKVFQGFEKLERERIERDLNRISLIANIDKPDNTDYHKDSLSQEEIARVLAHTTDPKERLMIGLMYYTGLRTFEVLNIKQSDFNFKAKVLNVVGKGNKKAEIPLNHCLNAIETLFKDYLKATKIKNNVLFPTMNSTSQIRSFVNRILNDLDLKKKKKKVSCHSFRHSLAQNLLLNGIPLEAVQSILRHNQISTTEIYFKKIQNERLIQIPENTLTL